MMEDKASEEGVREAMITQHFWPFDQCVVCYMWYEEIWKNWKADVIVTNKI